MFDKLTDKAHRASYKQLLAAAKESRGGRLLDLGCANGQFTLEFARKVHATEIFGVEIDKEVADQAKGRGIEVLMTNLNEPLPLPSEYFDLVLCREVMHHLTNPDNLLEESYRLLKPGGRLYITVPNLCSLHNRLLVLLGRQPTVIPGSSKFQLSIGGGVRGSRRAYSPAAFKKLVVLHGFKIERYFGSGFYPFQGKIANLLSNLFPALSVLQSIVASKPVTGQEPGPKLGATASEDK